MTSAADLEHEEIRGELRSLLRSVRALVEAHREAGSVGLPVEGDTWVQTSPRFASEGASAAGFTSAPPRATSTAPELTSAAPEPTLALPRTTPAAAELTSAAPRATSAASQAIAATPQVVPAAPAVPSSTAPHAVPAAPSVARPPVAVPSEPVFPPLEPPTPPAQVSLFSSPPPPPPRGAVLPPGELRRRLSLIESQASSCTKCALGATRQRTVFSRGNPESELCFIGEGPGAEEEAAGQPFVGPAGQLLDKMIVAMGIAPEEVYIAHVVKCRLLPNKPPAPEEMAACMPYMHEQLELIKPRVIVALGATATKGLLGTHLGIKALRGTWKNYRGTIPLMPTYHPAYLLKDPSVKKEAWKDLQSVLERLGRQPPRKTS